MGCIILNHQHKGSFGTSQTPQAVVKAISCSPQPDSKALFLKTTLGYVIDYEEDRLVLDEKIHNYNLVLIVMGVTFATTVGEKRNQHQPTTNLGAHSTDFPIIYTGVIVAWV